MPKPESWRRIVTRAAAEIRQRHGVPDQATEDRMVRVFRTALRPRRKAERKPSHATERAPEMWVTAWKVPRTREAPPLRAYQRQLWIYSEISPDFGAHGQANPAAEPESVSEAAGV